MMRIDKKTIVLMISLTASLVLGCNTEEVIFDARIQQELDFRAVEEFISNHNLDVTTHPSGFKYVVTDAGSGDPIDGFCRWHLKLTVYHLDSTYAFSNYEDVERAQGFEAPTNEGYTAYPCGNYNRPQALHSLDGLIEVGGKIQLFVPSSLAWGTEGFRIWRFNSQTRQTDNSEIPPNTNVLISAELIEVQ